MIEPKDMKPLFIPLKAEFWNDFVNGLKKEEFRPYGPRWNEKTCPVGREVLLSKGYGKKYRAVGVITGFRTSTTVPRRKAWKTCYAGKGHKVAACIAITITKYKLVVTHHQVQPTNP